MIFSVRTDRHEKLVLPRCDEPLNGMADYMLPYWRCDQQRGHEGVHLADGPGGRRSSWREMTEGEWLERQEQSARRVR